MHETSGVTRDRKELVCEWNGKRFLLIDTGGVDIADPSPIDEARSPSRRSRRRRGRPRPLRRRRERRGHAGDEELADILRRARKPVFLLANKIDDPAQETPRARVPPARPRRPACRSPPCTATARRPARRDRRALPGTGREEIGGRGDPRRDPRPAERRQVVAPERDPRPGARDRLGDRPARRATRSTRLPTRRPHVRPRRHGRHPPQAQAPAGDRVLLGAARAARRPSAPTSRSSSSTRPRVSSTTTSPSPTSRARRSARRSSCSRSGTSTTVGIEDMRRRARAAAAAAAAARRRLGEDRPRSRAAARPRSRSSTKAHRARPDGRAEPLPRRAARGAPAAVARAAKRLNLLYGAQVYDAAAAFPLLRQRPDPRHARLRLLGREPAARPLRAGGRAGDDRLRQRSSGSGSSRQAACGSTPAGSSTRCSPTGESAAGAGAAAVCVTRHSSPAQGLRRQCHHDTNAGSGCLSGP